MPTVFFSYRREDTADIAGRIFDWLAPHFGTENLFKDVDSIPLGANFVEYMEAAVNRCNVVIAIIGPGWYGTSSTQPNRLQEPSDFVRVELELALKNEIPIIPVLVYHADMPSTNQLPETLVPLIYRHAIAIRPDPDFRTDMDRLARAIVNYTPGATPSGPLHSIADSTVAPAAHPRTQSAPLYGPSGRETNPLSPSENHGKLSRRSPAILGRGSGIRTAILAGVAVIVVAVVLGALTVGLHLGANSSTPPTTATTANGEHIVYQNSLTTISAGWATNSQCGFESDGYHVIGTICWSPADPVGDATITVTVKQSSPQPLGAVGIFFRATLESQSGEGYSFAVDGQGDCGFYKFSNGNGTMILNCTQQNSAYRPGPNSITTLQVRASGANFEFFVNGTQVGSATDTSFSSGIVGLESTPALDAVFTDLTITQPSQ
jgi:hypothetical protein